MNYSTTFRQHYKDKYEGLNQVYTDASKKGSEGPVGIGICALEIGWTLSEKLPSYISTCIAEIIAIWRVIKYVKEKKDISKAIIITETQNQDWRELQIGELGQIMIIIL
ncbi:hypothetical protein HHI36_024016 [Cryptolaemus montrouzieri]|uniref:RNase H type-1 domain-containing protein n=1 Tax=Cryptolaemus montrouzieri TaxID=559131 RepID=A0ABD2MMG7_9CUCU